MESKQFNKIHIGSDHAGYEYKQALIEALKSWGVDVVDQGPYGTDSCDYPDYVHPAVNAIKDLPEQAAVLICGSGNGVCMTANKYAHMRAALCWNQELSSLARLHNNANGLCIPARFVDLDTALKMLHTFLNTPFEGGRHQRRVTKISEPNS